QSQPASRFGKFERLTPPSLQFVDVSKWKRREVPTDIERPPYAESGEPSVWEGDIPILNQDATEKMTKAGDLARCILDMGGKLCQPGITTDSIDKILHAAILSEGAYPSPLNYMGFPKSVCTSINNVIAHGIPDHRQLKNGDIINIDVTVYLDGYHGDTSATFLVGNVDDPGRALVECTKAALDKAIAACGPGVPLKEIGRIISEYAALNSFSVSEELSGHGIGKQFHCLPLIYHHANDEDGIMEPGMAFTIEPILCQGSAVGIQWPDKWTITTADGGRSAQFEHTVVITEDGCNILTD
ncbi:peptidase M24, structural domain-containing protein, partial [Umbelopsis sp. PMI_123]